MGRPNGSKIFPVDEIFSEALGMKDSNAREAFLAEAAAGRDGVLTEVKELLAAHFAAGEFLTETEVASEEKETPKVVGYEIGRLLGRGGIGAVYEAHDEKLQRSIALKILGAGEGRKRILAEARRAASLSDPAIVTIFAVHEDGASPAIAMELVEGFRIDRATAALSVEQKARILQRVARAIAVAHRAGVIHRDLKPENVIVTPDLQPKVLDFGIALTVEEAGVERKFFEGTPAFASPEQIEGGALTTASDIFSFGSLMFKVLTGRAPFEGTTTLEVLEKICSTEPPFLRDVAAGVPEDLQAICLACLASEANERPMAEEIVADLGRFLAGEPVRLRPALYGDVLRRKISEYAGQVAHWEKQGMISNDEKDRLETVHRRILADEDHWIIDARKISLAQTALYTGSWLVVISAALAVWLARNELPTVVRWLAPLGGTTWLLAAGVFAWRRKEPMASASFLAGAVLSVFPLALSLLKEGNILTGMPAGSQQMLAEFSNAQILMASVVSLVLSNLAWRRLRMTGFAWTTAFLAALSYWGVLLCFNWLGQRPEIMALWLTPLVVLEAGALACEKIGRVRWAMPFHLNALLTLIGTLDVIAWPVPTLAMLGFREMLNAERLKYFSMALNGYLFLTLMLVTERARSLDLRRASRVLEGLALLHTLGPLYANALAQRGQPNVHADVAIYLATAFLLLLMGPWRSSWRMLVGALTGLALGSYLLLDLELVGKAAFTLSLGAVGIAASAFMGIRLGNK